VREHARRRRGYMGEAVEEEREDVAHSSTLGRRFRHGIATRALLKMPSLNRVDTRS